MNKIAKYCWEVGGERKGTEKECSNVKFLAQIGVALPVMSTDALFHVLQLLLPDWGQCTLTGDNASVGHGKPNSEFLSSSLMSRRSLCPVV